MGTSVHSSDGRRGRAPGNIRMPDGGFSVVELAVVIVVIGILVAIAVPVLTEMNYASRKAKAESAAANAERMIAIELTMSGTADTSTGSLATELGQLRIGFASGLAGATITVNPELVSSLYCVTATVPGFGVATAGSGCSDPGWRDE